MNNNSTNKLAGLPKYAIGFVGTLAFRLISPFLGLWNVSPLMATEFAGSKAYGPLVGGLYGALSIVLLDLLVGKAGTWTIITGVTYGLVGVFGAFYFNSREGTARNFIAASIVGTLFFDLITGVLMGPILYGQPWMEAIIGQIPFTVRHLVGNIAFAGILAPWFYRKVMMNPKLQTFNLFKFA